MLLIFLRFINSGCSSRKAYLSGVFGVCMACGLCAGAVELNPAVAPPGERQAGPVHEPVVAKPPLDRSGHKRLGKASFYARKFAGRKMADGTVMQPQGDNAASKTLPLGTTARVTNLENGRSAVVTIRDRGPYIQGRIVDLSPSTAKEIGIEHKNGVVKVEVAPIVVPLPDGHVKLGAAVTDSEQAGRLALSSNNFAHLPNAEFPDLVDIHVRH
jgi:rare lipoprotein A